MLIILPVKPAAKKQAVYLHIAYGLQVIRRLDRRYAPPRGCYTAVKYVKLAGW
jgi:hypothetical protein